MPNGYRRLARNLVMKNVSQLQLNQSRFIRFISFLTTKKGILEISYECRPSHHLLMPADQGFAILNPFGLYSLVAGSKDFVEIAVGSTIETAREMFWEFATTDWQEPDKSFLTQIARKYQSFS